MRGCRRVNDQSFGITNVGELTGELETVDEFAALDCTTLYTEAEHSTEYSRPQNSLRDFVGAV